MSRGQAREGTEEPSLVDVLAVRRQQRYDFDAFDGSLRV